MKILYVVVLCFLSVHRVSLAQTDGRELDSFMNAAHQANLFNGVVLVSRHDSLLLQKGYGYRNVGREVPHDSLSVFQIGSLSKSFTATCILQQMEQGRLQLTDPLSKYFPAYHNGAKET